MEVEDVYIAFIAFIYHGAGKVISFSKKKRGKSPHRPEKGLLEPLL